MSTTNPIRGSVISRISNQLTRVSPKYIPESAIADNICCFPFSPYCSKRLASIPAIKLQARCRCQEGIDAVQWTTVRITQFGILFEIEKLAEPGNTGTDSVFDWMTLKALFVKPSVEWEEYGEPLWSPVKSEARSLVKKFFEQADAYSVQSR